MENIGDAGSIARTSAAAPQRGTEVASGVTDASREPSAAFRSADASCAPGAAAGLSSASCAPDAAFGLVDAQFTPGLVSGLMDVMRIPGAALALADAQLTLGAVSGLVDVKCAPVAWLIADTGFGPGYGVYASGAEVAARVGRRASGMGWPPTKQISAPSSSS